MQKPHLGIIRHMAKGTANKPSSGDAKGGALPTGINQFLGGNWPSKDHGGQSGRNRGQGSKA